VVGIPLSGLFIALVVAAQVGMRYWNMNLAKDPNKKLSVIERFGPFVIYSLLLIIFDPI